jgi:YfiH family protein
MENSRPQWIAPDWPAAAHVRALISTRSGGASEPPFDSLNLAQHVEDDADQVAINRSRLAEAAAMPDHPQWLQQVHGTKLVEADNDGVVRTADACWSDQPGVACTVMTADCLPLLVCDREGTRVAAIHAGWRGLAAGIVRDSLEQLQIAPQDTLVYLGPAISQKHFEVGIDVLEAFFDSAIDENHGAAVSAAFRPSLQKPMKYQADLCALARAELAALGVTEVYGGDYCTFEGSDRFYSYRRDGRTGRMASIIWLDPI